MATDDCGAHVAARGRRGETRLRTAARSVVALCSRDRGVRDGVGVAAAPGVAATNPGSGKRETGGGSFWRRLTQAVRGSSGANAAEAERILLEADFGVEATEAILTEVSRAPDGDFRAALER